MNTDSPPLLRSIFWVVLALAVPLVPFFLWGAQVEAWVKEQIQTRTTHWEIAVGAILALTADIVLPIPSSLVGTFVGLRLDWPVAVGVIWVGLMCGACLGFALARWLGAPLAAWCGSPSDQQRMARLAERYGTRVLIYTRALPGLAEASVLLLGIARLEWRVFLWPVAGSNLILALVYATLGYTGRVAHAELWALLASVVIPLLAAWYARRFWSGAAHMNG
jgi:3-dehydroquinate synthase